MQVPAWMWEVAKKCPRRLPRERTSINLQDELASSRQCRRRGELDEPPGNVKGEGELEVQAATRKTHSISLANIETKMHEGADESDSASDPDPPSPGSETSLKSQVQVTVSGMSKATVESNSDPDPPSPGSETSLESQAQVTMPGTSHLDLTDSGPC